MSLKYIMIYLDAPERGRSQVVQLNAKKFYKEPKLSEFFAEIVKKNPNILLGNNCDWAKMFHKDKEAFVRLARNQKQTL